MSVTHNDNQTIIGRAEINDIDAILAIPTHDPNEVAHIVKDNADAIFTWDYSLGPAGAAQAVREGQGRAVERHHRPAVGHRCRRREDRRRGSGPDRHRYRPHHLHRHTGREVGRQAVAGVRRREPQLDPQPVHARRAGRAAVHRQDRRDRSVVRRQAVRQHPSRRRGPPRRGLRPLPRGEARRPVPDQLTPAHVARRHRQRQPMGHDVLGHAGDGRGPGAGRVRLHAPVHRRAAAEASCFAT